MRTLGANSHRAPAFNDLTKDEKAYGFRPTTAVLAKQLDAIHEFNQALPPKKKAKESLPEISAPNVYAKTMVKFDPKKKTREFTHKYLNIGFADESNMHNQDQPKNAAEGFNIVTKSRGLQM